VADSKRSSVDQIIIRWNHGAPIGAESIEELVAEVERLRDLLLEAIDAARTFNRNGMSWKEYDALLTRLEAAGKGRHA